MPKKGEGTFVYPGGKTVIAQWIIDHFPQHGCYVEPFGGSASVLAKKPRSDIEVYNDIQNDAVHFFKTLRERRDDLIEWVRATPYARSQFEEWADEFGKGHRPDDDVERAGRFFSLRQMSYGGKIQSPTFKRGKTGTLSCSQRFVNSKQSLRELANRLETVIIENNDYKDIVTEYDTENALFYFDPPYVTGGEYYINNTIDHDEFVSLLADVEGKWIVSYDELPPGLDGYHCVTRTRKWTISQDRSAEGTEKLIMNFDPEQTPSFSGENQSLSAYSDA